MVAQVFEPCSVTVKIYALHSQILIRAAFG